VTGLVFRIERGSQDRESPKAVGQQNMVEQLDNFSIGNRSRVLVYSLEHRGVSESLVRDEVPKQLEHGVHRPTDKRK
jgi:hypothetical protein